MSQTSDPVVAALLRERAGYVQRGLDGRVAEVDAELVRLGHTPPGAAQAETVQRAEPPKGRRAPAKRTTSKDGG